MTTNPMTANDLFKRLRALNEHFAEGLTRLPSLYWPGGEGFRAIEGSHIYLLPDSIIL